MQHFLRILLSSALGLTASDGSGGLGSEMAGNEGCAPRHVSPGPKP